MSLEMQLHVVAALLRRGKSLDYLSTGLLLLSLLFGLVQLWIGSASLLMMVLVPCMVLTGALAKSQAFRVAFDADLFQHMADRPSQLSDRTQELDQVLADLKLQPAEKGGRNWALRTQGALRQLRLQVRYIVLQLLWLLGIIFIFPWLSFAQ
ncbi:hypothetical protein V2K52_19870 [Pseudomonas alliivorans]|nr:hypothetical protein [Pseudomonas alliivorans]MEE4794567.1 hypothetical protein [Pseudomonas alliivorans]MEE4799595.1 hypothetical protein [Pseudomonas alliivorans]MEE4809736.1 hypothetical protein [Pseudomonas alliivorans]MEE4824746.1 hypothetical protein [Pseudomonas alliivorans]